MPNRTMRRGDLIPYATRVHGHEPAGCYYKVDAQRRANEYEGGMVIRITTKGAKGWYPAIKVGDQVYLLSNHDYFFKFEEVFPDLKLTFKK